MGKIHALFKLAWHSALALFVLVVLFSPLTFTQYCRVYRGVFWGFVLFLRCHPICSCRAEARKRLTDEETGPQGRLVGGRAGACLNSGRVSVPPSTPCPSSTRDGCLLEKACRKLGAARVGPKQRGKRLTLLRSVSAAGCALSEALYTTAASVLTASLGRRRGGPHVIGEETEAHGSWVPLPVITLPVRMERGPGPEGQVASQRGAGRRFRSPSTRTGPCVRCLRALVLLVLGLRLTRRTVGLCPPP